MPSSGSHEPGNAGTGKAVLPSFLTPAILAAAAWVGIAVPLWIDAAYAEEAGIGWIPAGVVAVCTIWDYALWRRRGRPWHDAAAIILLLPAVAAAVWIAVGALILDLGLSREELLGLSVGPGVALVGLLCTAISYHGRHRPA